MEYQNTDQFQKTHTRIVTNTSINTVSKYCNLQIHATKCTVSRMNTKKVLKMAN